MTKYICDTAAAKQLKVYVVVRDGSIVGSIKSYFTDATCQVEVHQWGESVQTSKARGYGYDKELAAVLGLRFGDTVFKDGSSIETQLIQDGYECRQIL